ncbi:MAG: sulfur carrier protein ThiS [Clostridia bacterium]|nr:sulfur carrier protein ThiS [Clostridia bacterium]
MIRANGKEIDIGVKSVNEYLIDAGYDINRVAVEINGEILPKLKYGSTQLEDGDVVEVVSFVGGG